MAAEKALALVVRGIDWSESSRIATLFTREFGKIRALAKGGRRIQSTFDVAFDLLTVCQIVFLRKSHSGLDLLTEARVEQRFPALRQNLSVLYAGYYVAELLCDGTQDYDPHPDLFDAAIATLRKLGELGVSPLVAVSMFELAWLRELGYSPRLDACAGCERERQMPTAGALYSPSAGGVLCPNCGPLSPDRRPASGSALTVLRALAGGGGERPSELPDAVRAEVRQLLGQTVSNVLGRRPRMLGYLDSR